ncbi:MFS transporter [Microbacterium rhizomatis]|uniref:MFS transporter n=1 Tax=Microbacterium rhizomatis TaxID=1631477 RepID=UPI001478DD82|nr:MFS transporter [Microbacterium rhizomatis]
MTSFVFTVYLTSGSLGQPSVVESSIAWCLTAAGLIVAVLAPLVGNITDSFGRPVVWLGIQTALVVVLMTLMVLVQPHEAYLWFGLLLLAASNVAFSLAGVTYNALLPGLTTSRDIGRVSGLGMGMGFVGGVAVLLLALCLVTTPAIELLGIGSGDDLRVRVVPVAAAVWFASFAAPLFLLRSQVSQRANNARRQYTPKAILSTYAGIARRVAALWRYQRATALFLLASAVYRDGLAGIYTFGGILAAAGYGLSASDVIVFAIVSNVVAAVSTMAVGRLDTRTGGSSLILVCLVALLCACTVLFVLHGTGPLIFWIAGLTMAALVGPVESASRSFLGRRIPIGQEGEMFGLYATTGRAAGFFCPAAFAVSTLMGGTIYFGILGIATVLALGLGMFVVTLIWTRNTVGVVEAAGSDEAPR